MTDVTDLKALSRLLSGELDPRSAAVLRGRLSEEPELQAAWALMQRLPARLEHLPDVPMPPALQQCLQHALAHPLAAAEAQLELPRRSRWAEAGLALAVAAAFLFVALRSVQPPLEATEGAKGVGAPIPESVVVPPTTAPTPVAVEAPDSLWLFRPDLPSVARRPPHRPRMYQAPPPGGRWQFKAVDSGRRKDCVGALSAVQEGMRESIDHITLYRGAWFCFNDAHQRKLEQANASTWADFELLLAHFEVIEHRVGVWTQDDDMVEIIDDMFGAPNVADHIAKDVHLEALAAEALSGEHARLIEAGQPVDPALVTAWSRRVLVTRFALGSRAGRVLGEYRPELVPQLRGLLAAATTPRTTAWGEVIPLPDEVLAAMGDSP